MKALHLFAGIGGGALGFQRAGCDTVGAVDFDASACRDFELLVGRPCTHGDLSTMTPAELAAACTGRPDVVRWARARATQCAARRAKYETPLECEHCGGGFLALPRGGRRQRFCSRKCSTRKYTIDHRAEATARMRVRRARPPKTISCQGCGTEIVQKRKCHRFCSQKCIQRARRRRIRP